MHSVNTEVNTDDVKTLQDIKTEQDSRGEEDV